MIGRHENKYNIECPMPSIKDSRDMLRDKYEF